MPERPTLVTFRCSGNLWAVDVADVLEVVRLGPLTRVPGASARVAGVFGWRGRTVPVISLPSALKRSAESPDQKKRVLVLGRPEPFGVLIDRSERILAPAEWDWPTGGEAGDSESPVSVPALGLACTDVGLARILEFGRLAELGAEGWTREGPGDSRGDRQA